MGRAMQIRTAGSSALLVCLDDPAQVTGLYRALLRDPPEGFVDAVPAAETVLVLYDPSRTDRLSLSERIRAAADQPPTAIGGRQGPRITIPVRYDGPDLEEIARITGLSVAEVVHRHTAGEYVVAFCGFAPGFAYLTGLDPALRLPRRAVPRTRVPAGSVAMSDRFTSVYPSASPGGWHLLGRTTMAMWDIDHQPPGLLTPGTRVRFEQVAA